jgi:cobalt-zinc-cadmium efflux system membrane fusion protein
VSGQIAHLLPALNAPYQIARVAINNAEERWSPGMLVEGNILVNTHEVALKVEKSAVQSLEGQTGVFVKGGTTYTFAPLAFGRSDAKAVEVLSGLAKGQPYVSANSYLIKADIEKSAAEHVH